MTAGVGRAPSGAVADELRTPVTKGETDRQRTNVSTGEAARLDGRPRAARRPEKVCIDTEDVALGVLGAEECAATRADPSPDLLPRQGPDRLRALDVVRHAIAVDVHRTLDELVAEGWSRDDALAAIDDYREWLVGNVATAVETGRDSWRGAGS